MARPKENTMIVESEVARLVMEMCNRSDKTQLQIAEDAGLAGGTNIITMFKSGRTKFPIRRIKAFCDAVDGDPEVLLEACLREYMPEVLEVVTAIKGRVLSAEERELVLALRAAKRDEDKVRTGRSHWSINDKDAIREWAEQSAKKLTA